MASGTKNKLTGQVGEHLVAAMLGTLGYYASPYSGNVPGFDVTAVDSETLRSFPIQVKASNAGALIQSRIDKWCEHDIDESGHQRIGAPKELKHPDMIWIMVRLPASGIDGARFFICTERQIQQKMIERYSAFMARHDYRRPSGSFSKQAILSKVELIEFEGNWEPFINPLSTDVTK